MLLLSVRIGSPEREHSIAAVEARGFSLAGVVSKAMPPIIRMLKLINIIAKGDLADPTKSKHIKIEMLIIKTLFGFSINILATKNLPKPNHIM